MNDAGKKRLIGVLVVVLVYLITLLGFVSWCTLPTETQQTSVSIPEPIGEIPESRVEQTPSAPALAAVPQEPSVPAEPEEILKEEKVVAPSPESSDSVITESEFAETPPVAVIEDAPPPEPVIITSPEEPLSTEVEETFDDFEIAEESEDPWADFYVAGEEDYSIFDDGEYYVPLIVNTEYLNDITVTFLSDTIYVNVAEFELLVSELLTETYARELFSTTEEYFSLDYLNEQGIETWYDYQTFELYMNFPTFMMPTRVLSINQGSLARYSSYSMGGSTFLEPEFFSWFANLSLYSLVELAEANQWEISPTSLLTLQSRNSLAIADLGFDFSYTVHPGRAYNELLDTWSNTWEDYLTFQGIQGFYDYKPKSLRFVFGNVNDYLGYSLDTIGVGVEKRYSYGDARPKNHQYEYEILIEEPSLVEVFINERSVYRRELQAGIYKLRDFAFAQGANNARIVVEPIADPTQISEYNFVLGFDSRLLARGDTLYRASLSFPQYDIANTVLRVDQQFGLTDEITSQYALALSTSAVNVSLSHIIATPFGSFDALTAASYNHPQSLGFRGSLSYRINGDEESLFGSLNLSAGFASNRYTTSLSSPSIALGHTFDASLSFTGRITESLRYSIGGSLTWMTHEQLPSWRLSLSSGIPLIPRMTVSGSVSLFASPASPVPELRGQISLNYSFSPDLSVSASTNLETSANVSSSWRPFGSSNNSVQASFTGINFDNPTDHQGSISYSRSADRYGMSIRQQYSDSFSRFTTSLSLSTSIAYAGGMFGMTRSISDNFLLVKPGGAMKGSDVAVTRTMTSEPTALPSLFGVGTYTGITTHQQNNVVVYGIGDSLMGNSESFIYDFLPRPRQGYAIRISSELSYSLVGTLLRSPEAAYSRYTTDIAQVVTDEDGNETLIFDETRYLFTDEYGFFYVSGLTAGVYQFSLFLPNSSEEDPPVDVRFTIEEDPDMETAQVLVLETFTASEISDALEEEFFAEVMGESVEETIFDENGFYWLTITETMDEMTFWDSYYPSIQVVDSVSESEEEYSDFYVEFIDLMERPVTALERMRQDDLQRLFNLSRLRSIVQPYIDAIVPQDGWKPDLPR